MIKKPAFSTFRRLFPVCLLLVCLILVPILSESSESREFRIIASRTTDEITIDGNLNEPAWKNAQSAGDFTILGANRDPAFPRTSVKILTDGKNLFLGFICDEPDMKNLKSSEKPRDGDVFHDDSVEVILDPTNERKVIFHLIANAEGSRYDTSGTIQGMIVTEKKKWNGSWKSAASKQKEAWFSEWKIPLSDLGVSEDFPLSMGINLCRTRFRDSINYSSWSPCRMRFIEPDRLGDLILSSESEEYCFVDFPRGKVFSANHQLPQFDIGSFYNTQKKFRFAYVLKSIDAGEQTDYSEILLVPGKDSKKISGPTAPESRGFHKLLIRLEDAETGQLVNVITRYFEVRPGLEIVIKPFSLYAKRIEAVVNIFHPEADKPGAFLSVTLFRENENRPLVTIKRETLKNGNEPFSFSLAGMPEARYLLKAELRIAKRLVCRGEGSLLFYSPEPEIGFTQDRFLKVGDKPFFPVGMYTLQSRTPGLSHDDVLAEAREAGFNTTVFYAFNLPDVTKLLDAAARNDMKAFVYVSNPYNVRKGKWLKEEIERDLAARLNHPALLGWYLVDEPEGIGKTNQNTLRRFYETVKGRDMNHPCSLVIMSPHAASVYGFHSDIVWVDPYPVPDYPVTFVSERIDGVIKAVKGERPVWAVLQAFDWNKWRKGAIDRVHRPTPEEERCMTYLALVHGAKGVIFWAHTASRYYIRDYPEHWNVMKRIAGELRELSPVLLISGPEPDIQVSPENVSLDTMVKTHRGNAYIFAVNRETSPCKASFGLKEKEDAAIVEVLFENRTIKAQSGKWNDAFAPLEVHVYKFPFR